MLISCNNIAKPNKTILGALALSTGLLACTPRELKRVDEKNFTTEYIDSFTKSNFNKVDTIDKFCFKKDTINLDEECFENFEKLNDYVDREGRFRNPNLVTGSKMEYVYTMKANGKPGYAFRPKTQYEHLAEPSSIQARVTNEVYTDKNDSTQIYIPVEFWGAANPNLKLKHVQSSKKYQQFENFFK